MRPTAVLASALVRPATVVTAAVPGGYGGGEGDGGKRGGAPTIVVECASCRPSCWLPRRARPSSVEGGRGAGKGLNPLSSSGAGGSGGGGTTVKGGGTGECAEAATATIPCRSPRAIDRKHLRPGDEFTTQQRPPRSARAAGPVRVPRESNSEREMGGSSWGGACGVRGTLPPARPTRVTTRSPICTCPRSQSCPVESSVVKNVRASARSNSEATS